MKIAIVEDEDAAADLLHDYLMQYAEQKGVLIETVRFVDPTMLLEQYRPIYDLVFMDIVMPHINGYVAAQELRKLDENVLLIFVTNMRNYAIKGYEVGAFDFVVKPIKYNVINMKMNRVLQVLANQKKDRCISVSVNGAKKVLSLENILYVEINGHTLTYHTTEGNFSARDSLEKAELALGDGFARCNSCYLVNLAYVREVQQNTVVVAGQELPISRNKKKSFLSILANYCHIFLWTDFK